MMRICMYHDVWKFNVLAGKINPGQLLEDDVEFFVSAGDDVCKNKPVGEDDSVGE